MTRTDDKINSAVAAKLASEGANFGYLCDAVEYHLEKCVPENGVCMGIGPLNCNESSPLPFCSDGGAAWRLLEYIVEYQREVEFGGCIDGLIVSVGTKLLRMDTNMNKNMKRVLCEAYLGAEKEGK